MVNCHFKKLTEVSITVHHTDIRCRVLFLLVWGSGRGIKAARISTDIILSDPVHQMYTLYKARVTTARLLYKLLDIERCKCLFDRIRMLNISQNQTVKSILSKALPLEHVCLLFLFWGVELQLLRLSVTNRHITEENYSH